MATEAHEIDPSDEAVLEYVATVIDIHTQAQEETGVKNSDDSISL